MKPVKILDIMDLALEIRNRGGIWNPMFVGDAGLGKSQILQQWVGLQKKRNPKFRFIDCRIAYFEGPDFVGYSNTIEIDGVMRTIHALPEMWPTEGEGLILFEEPNRGNSMVMNCLMQVLTDRKIGHAYHLPEGWLIAGAMNPEGAKYNVEGMDTALADRFEMFNIEYDFQTFASYIEEQQWNNKTLNFIKSGTWVYKTPDSLAKDGKYISPRTWSKINEAEQAGASEHPNQQATHQIICTSILGKHVGNEYWKTCWDDAPITAQDILTDKTKALAKLKKQSKANGSYAGDKVTITIDSVIAHYGGWFEGQKDKERDQDLIDEATMAEIALIVPADHAVNLIKGCGARLVRQNPADTSLWGFLKAFVKRNPKLVDILRDSIKMDRK